MITVAFHARADCVAPAAQGSILIYVLGMEPLVRWPDRRGVPLTVWVQRQGLRRFVSTVDSRELPTRSIAESERGNPQCLELAEDGRRFRSRRIVYADETDQ